MIVYFAAYRKAENIALIGPRANAGVLVSYYKFSNADKVVLAMARRHRWRTFLDSGAFTAIRTNERIDVGRYADFCLEHGRAFDVVSNLDVIGDPEGSAKNFAVLVKRKVPHVIPVYHYGSDPKFLDAILDAGADYVALGGVARMMLKAGRRAGAQKFFADTFKRIDGRARVHGFGITGIKTMALWPWYSVDSTAPVKAGNRNMLFVGSPPRLYSPLSLARRPLAAQLRAGGAVVGARNGQLFVDDTRRQEWVRQSTRCLLDYADFVASRRKETA